MKQFLYLDYDMVNSIIAQAEKGVILSFTNEESNSDSNSSDNTTAIDSKAEVSGSLLGVVKGNSNVNYSHSHNNEEQKIMMYKEIVSKSLHDAAFDKALNYISPQNAEQQDYAFGEYYQISRPFEFVDLEYLQMLFSKDGVIDFLKESTKAEIEQQFQSAEGELNRNQIRQSNKIIKEKIRATIKNNNSSYETAYKIIRVISQLVPYSRMMISKDGFLIPLADEYFRIKPENLGFKYGGEMKCVGVITNIIDDSKDEDQKSIFASLQTSINITLKSILPTEKNIIYVVHPLAVFYENNSNSSNDN